MSPFATKSSLTALAGAVLAMSLGASQAVTVVNGDFEADSDLFGEWPGYTGGANPAEINAWPKTGAGGVGVNPAGPVDHANRTPFDDGSTVNTTTFAFLQGDTSISQEITGFSVGADYLLNIEFNARACCGDPVGMPAATISLNDAVVASSIDLFGGDGAIPPTEPDAAWYQAEIPFTASSESLILKIASAPAVGADATLVIDNVSITANPIPEPSSGLLALLGGSLLVARRRKQRDA